MLNVAWWSVVKSDAFHDFWWLVTRDITSTVLTLTKRITFLWLICRLVPTVPTVSESPVPDCNKDMQMLAKTVGQSIFVNPVMRGGWSNYSFARIARLLDFYWCWWGLFFGKFYCSDRWNFPFFYNFSRKFELLLHKSLLENVLRCYFRSFKSQIS